MFSCVAVSPRVLPYLITRKRDAALTLQAYSSFWAPVINLAREPRWGRNIETPGEDPYLTSQYAIHYTKGMQESPDDTVHIQASACCKHYIGNTMEFTTQLDGESENRGSVDSNISMRDLVDTYMVPFQACVEVGKVSGLMCSCEYCLPTAA